MAIYIRHLDPTVPWEREIQIRSEAQSSEGKSIAKCFVRIFRILLHLEFLLAA